MKYLLLLLPFLLTGCGDDDIVTIHHEAKMASITGHKVCYNVSDPAPIVGRYCLEYVGPRK